MIQNNNLNHFYLKTTFNIEKFSWTRLDSGNILSRLFNNLVRAINAKILLPKVVIIVINNDILREIHFNGFGISRILGICIEYLIKSIHQLLINHKNTLLAKAVKFKYPTILWVLLPGHNNFTNNATRSKLAAAIEKSALLYNEM